MEQELADLKTRADALRAQWQVEKAGVGRLGALQEQIEAVKREIEPAERAYNLNRVAELRYGRLADLERRLQKEEAGLAQRQSGRRLLKEDVDEEDIATGVSGWTGIPVTKLLEGEMQKLVHLDEALHKRVIGQDARVHGETHRGLPDRDPTGIRGV